MKTDHVMAAGNVVYVSVGDRERFDQIDRPVTDHSEKGRKLLTKVIGDMASNEGAVVFQHWLELTPIDPLGVEEAKGTANE